LHTGGSQPPEWYINLELAEIWHCKPWELDCAPIEWVLRQVALCNIRAELDQLRRDGLGG